MFVFILFLVWLIICAFWYGLTANIFIAFLLGTGTFIGLILLLSLAAVSLSGSEKTDMPEKNKTPKARNSSSEWTDDDWLALMMTNDDWQNKF